MFWKKLYTWDLWYIWKFADIYYTIGESYGPISVLEKVVHLRFEGIFWRYFKISQSLWDFMRYLLVLKLYANDSLTLYVCFQIHSTNTSLSSGMQLTYLCKAKTLSQIKSTLGSIPPLADVSHIALPTLRPKCRLIMRRKSTARISLIWTCHLQESPSLNQQEIPLNKSSGGNSAAEINSENICQSNCSQRNEVINDSSSGNSALGIHSENLSSLKWSSIINVY